MGVNAVGSAGVLAATLRQQTTEKPKTGESDGATSSVQLSAEQQAQVDKLKARDEQVHRHEQAHLAASGGLAVSGPSYTYERGPDGVSYAVGGEVSIDTSPGRTPEETLERARTIAAAALAPADPSATDRAVAAQARQMEQQAASELALQAGVAATGSAARNQVEKAYGATAAPPATISVRA